MQTKKRTPPSLLPSQNNLIALTATALELLLSVAALVLLAALDRLELLLLDLARLLDYLGHVPMALDASDLGLW